MRSRSSRKNTPSPDQSHATMPVSYTKAYGVNSASCSGVSSWCMVKGDALIRNEELLQRHFDAPFDMVQTKKRLKIQKYLPAMTRFLFSRPGQYKAQQRHGPLDRNGHTLLRPRNLRQRQPRVEVLHHQRRQSRGQLRRD